MTTRQTNPTLRLIVIACLYTPAGIALMLDSCYGSTPADRLLALAMLLFCIELARMAWVDLDNIAAIEQQQRPKAADAAADTAAGSLLKSFRITTLSTVVLELLGFYGTRVSLPWGSALVIFSQIWFNLLAGIQLWPQRTEVIAAFGIRERLPVLIANLVALILICLWVFAPVRLWISTGLLTIVILFLLIKYVVPTFQRLQNRSEQPPTAASATQKKAIAED